MQARAVAAAATGRRILEAAIHNFGGRPYDEVTLADVAREACVTVQTVLRRFGSKEGLVAAAAELGADEVRAQRWETAPGDLEAAVRGLVEHYELWGERSLRFLAQEERVEAMRRVSDAGRRLHHDWVEHAFGPQLDAVSAAARERLLAQLVAVTDVSVWKILRRDLGLDASETERSIRELVGAVVGSRRSGR
jgi:AcrR family transcriptional regulator